MQGKKQILALLLSTLLVANVFASDDSYYDRFLEVSKTQKGFISDVSLVDTNNAGPKLTNAPISFSAFAGNGELAGIKLGMDMSHVVAAWGKPPLFYTFCGPGPRFWYGRSRNFGTITLAFKEDRLAIIAVDLHQMPRVTFDNGLNGMTSDLECEKILGKSTLRSPRGWFFSGDAAYCTNGLRTDLHFTSVAVPQSSRTMNALWMLSVASKDAEHPLRVATITNLIQNPDSYDGLKVKIEGYLKAGRELSALYQNQVDASQSGDENVWVVRTIRAGHEKNVQSIKEGKVRVIGVVDCNLRSVEFGIGRSNHWDIKISELELLEQIKD